ncbi:MAG: protein translocase subunit SecF [Chloroflexi bacterium]|nr:protein translocase subunit SecF [Chloroflexota bacterium]
MFDIVRWRKWFYLFTGLLVLGAIVALIVPPHLPFGLEFSSGSSIDATFKESVSLQDVRGKLDAIGLKEATIQQSGDKSFLIRTKVIEEGLLPILEKQFGKVTTVNFDGPTDLAASVTFANAVNTGTLFAYFGQTPPASVQLGNPDANRILVVAPGTGDDVLNPVLQKWQQAYGAFDRVDFNGQGDVATQIQFKNAVAAKDVADELTKQGAPTVITTQITSDALLLSGKDIAFDLRDKALGALDTRFGENTKTPFDFSNGRLFTVRFTAPVTLSKVQAEILSTLATENVAANATVRRNGPGTFLLRGLTPDKVESVVANLQQALGPADVTRFQADKDLALVIDFGPDVTLPQFTQQAQQLGIGLITDTAGGANTFAVLGDAITPQQRDDLLARLDVQFGKATLTQFDQSNDLRLIMKFDTPPTLADAKDELTKQGIAASLVLKLDVSRLFVGAKAAPDGTRQKIIDALTARFGNNVPADLPAENTIAMTLNYGAPVDLATMRRELISFGNPAISVSVDDGTGLLLTGVNTAPGVRQSLINYLEQKYGPAKQTPIDAAATPLIQGHFNDQEKVAEAINNRMILRDNGNGSFFIAGHKFDANLNQAFFSNLAEAFSGVQQQPFNFTEGVATTLIFNPPVAPDTVKTALQPFGYTDLSIEQRTDGLFIKGSRPASDQRSTIVRALKEAGPLDEKTVQFATVDSQIAKRSITHTIYAVIAGTVGILLYIWYAFRKVNRPFRYGATAVVTLVHDILIIVGMFALLAKFTNVEIDSLMIVGVLAIIGHSINNTIVVFDRVRENVARFPARDFATSVNVSLNETLARNLNLSITTLVAILAIYLFGGETIRNFMLVLLIGVVAATYGGLFLAGNILVSWEKGELRLRLPWRRRPSTAQTQAPAART